LVFWLKLRTSYRIKVLRTNINWFLFRIKLLTPRANDNRIVISLTSYPGRFKFLQKTLKTLILQSTTPSAIRVYVEEKDFSEIGQRLTQLRQFGVTFHPSISGWRAATKLIPELLNTEAKESLIIYLDDEILYPRTLVEGLITTMKRYPESDVIFSWGQIVPPWERSRSCLPEYSTWKTTNLISIENNFVVPLGVAGVMLKRLSAPIGIINLKKFQDISQSNDDLWFWCHFIQKNLRLEKSLKNIQPPVYWRGSQDNALWRTNIIQGENDKILRRLIAEYPEFKALLVKEGVKN
jgi:hypothetical protein